MRSDKINIPRLFPVDFMALPNNKVKKSGVIIIKIPVVWIFFSDSVDSGSNINTQAEAKVRALRDDLQTVRDFYLENSYGKFEFDFRIKSVFLDNPSDWKGDADPSKRELDAEGNIINIKSFPRPEDYKGYPPFKLMNDKGEVAIDYRERIPKTNKSITGSNMAKAALNKLQESPIYPWDDPLSLAEFLNFGLPDGRTNATFVYGSNGIGGGGNRNFVNDFIYKEKILNDFIFCEFNSSRTASLLAHELGHVLGTPDLYGRGSAGYLGDISIMANDWEFSHFDAFLKYRFNWIEPEIISPFKGTKEITLSTIYQDSKNALLILPDPVGNPEEFFLIECRHKASQRWDGKRISFDNLLDNKHEGVFVYHVNTSKNISAVAPRIDLLGEKPEIKGSVTIGKFSGNGDKDGFLVYDNSKGEAAFYELDANSNSIKRVGNVKTGWRKTWDLIVPGHFGGSGHTDLLFYDRDAGEGEFHTTDGRGNIRWLGTTITGWRKTWDLIVPGNFGGSGHTDLLFYDRDAGEGEFHTTDGHGNIRWLGTTITGWSKTWGWIYSGKLRDSSAPDSELLFVNSINNNTEAYTVDATGRIVLFFRSSDLVALKPGDNLGVNETRFYDGTSTGLKISVKSRSSDSYHFNISW